MPARRPAAEGLALHVMDFLLGVTRPPGEIEQLVAQGYDIFAEFSLDTMAASEFLALWRRHGAALRAEATRRGIPIPDPSTYQPYPQGCWVGSGG